MSNHQNIKTDHDEPHRILIILEAHSASDVAVPRAWSTSLGLPDRRNRDCHRRAGRPWVLVSVSRVR